MDTASVNQEFYVRANPDALSTNDLLHSHKAVISPVIVLTLRKYQNCPVTDTVASTTAYPINRDVELPVARDLPVPRKRPVPIVSAYGYHLDLAGGEFASELIGCDGSRLVVEVVSKL